MGALDEDYEDEDGYEVEPQTRAPIGGLSSAQGNTSAWKARLEKEMADNNKSIDRFYAPRVKAYDAMAAAIRARRAGPTRAEQLFAISAALAAPTKYSGLGAAFSNLSPVLGAMEKDKRAEMLDNEGLAHKYKAGALDEEEGAFTATQTARQKLMDLASRYEIARTRQRPTPRVIVDSLGRARNPMTGAIFVQPPPAAIEYLRAHPDAAAEFDADYGDGSAVRYLGGG